MFLILVYSLLAVTGIMHEADDAGMPVKSVFLKNNFNKYIPYIFSHRTLLDTFCVATETLARLRNHIATDDGNVEFRSFKKFYIQSLQNKYKVVDLLAQKLLNDMTLD